MRSKNPANYLDVQRVIDAAREAGGAQYELPDQGKARYFIQKFHAMRVAHRAEDAKLRPPGSPARSDYEDVVLTRPCGCGSQRCQKPLDCSGNIVLIDVAARPLGILRTLEGKPVEIAGSVRLRDAEGDPLYRAALAAKRAIKEEGE